MKHEANNHKILLQGLQQKFIMLCPERSRYLPMCRSLPKSSLNVTNQHKYIICHKNKCNLVFLRW